MIEGDIKFISTKKQAQYPDLLLRIERGAAVRLAKVLAAHMRNRVSKKGITAQPFKGYASGRDRLIAMRYGHKNQHAEEWTITKWKKGAGGGQVVTRYNAIAYESSKDFHDGMKGPPGSFNVTGGMWGGLAVQGSTRRARVRFMGRSDGQNPWAGSLKGARKAYWRRVGRSIKKGEGYAGAKPIDLKGRKVSNALKAATVRDVNRINLLDLLHKERRDFAGAIEDAYLDATGASFIFKPSRALRRSRGSFRSRLHRAVLGSFADAKGVK